MKKILFLLMFIATDVNAETYYSEYTNFSEYSSAYIEQNDLNNVYAEERYIWGKEEKNHKEYQLLNDELTFDMETCYETEYNEFSFERPADHIGIIIDEKLEYEYLFSKKVSEIKIESLPNIAELVIKYNNNPLEYECEDCTTIKDSDFDTFYNNDITIKLDKDYPYKDIKIYLYFKVNSNLNYNVSYSDGEYYFNFNNVENISNNNLSVKVHGPYLDFINEWTYKVISDKKIEDEYIYKETMNNMYRYKEIYCKPYETINLSTTDYYLKYQDYDIKKDVRTYYKYQTRDKLTFKNQIITDYDFDLNNLIECTGYYEIKSNIDYNTNGLYDLYIYFDNKVIHKQIEVLIKENYIKSLEIQLNIEKLNNKNLTNLNYEKDNVIKNLNEELKAVSDNKEELSNNISRSMVLIGGLVVSGFLIKCRMKKNTSFVECE